MIEEGKDVLFCPYCGAKMIKKQDALDKILNHSEKTRHFEEEVRQRKVKESIEAEKRENKKTKKVLIGLLIVFVALLVIVMFGIRGENDSEAKLQALVVEIQGDVEAGNYELALFKTERLYWPHSDLPGKTRWDKQREALVRVIYEAMEKAEKDK